MHPSGLFFGISRMRAAQILLAALISVAAILVLMTLNREGHTSRTPAQTTPTVSYEDDPDQDREPPPPSDADIGADVIRLCQESVRDILRDPDSGKFSDWSAHPVAEVGSSFHITEFHPENGDRAWFARGLVNARNGFGGYVGNTEYDCDASINRELYINAVAWRSQDAQSAG